jgi:hypothetical protein
MRTLVGTAGIVAVAVVFLASTGDLGHSIRVASPYNLYFTPDGSKAIVVAEYDRLMEFRNPHT